jgi:nanoRNase/pAp phosphatase (c-di-AMP/oligoRNAs hydrolase)
MNAEPAPFDLDQALAALAGARRILVCPHDDPDPDALAAAWAMRRFLESELDAKVTIGFEGIIGRAENRAMVRELGIRLRRTHSLDPEDFDGVILVDTQPSASNHSAPAGLPVLGCIDHHPRTRPGAPAPWYDVRPDGETSTTIVVGYLLQRGVEVDPLLATAVIYALKTDTRDFTRGASEGDLKVYAHAMARADMHALGQIVNPQLEPNHYELAHLALETARVRGPAVVCWLPSLAYPDLVAEIADWLVRRRQTDWCLCAGVYKDSLRFSLRTEDPDGRAGAVAVGLVRRFGGSAGGHGMTAGGHISLDPNIPADELDRTWTWLSEDFLSHLGVLDEDDQPLCKLPG